MIQVKEVTCWYLVEQESSAGGSSEARGDEFCSVGQNGVTVGAGEQASPTDVVQEDPSHRVYLQQVKTKTKKRASLDDATHISFATAIISKYRE